MIPRCAPLVYAVVFAAAAFSGTHAFSPVAVNTHGSATAVMWASGTPSTAATSSFIDTELRGAAMKLHTREQAPKEGKVQAPESKPYTPTREDYLQFLVDSQHVYQAFEDIVNEEPKLEVFRNTGLERTKALETDIEFMCKEFGLTRPPVGEHGTKYAQTLREMKSVPELVCHYYNHYFAHTAGGLMIGKKMSSLLLDKKTLEFYKWDGDLNEMKATVKQSIEDMAARWSEEERQECVAGTPGAFVGGGSINSYLSGGRSPH